MRMREGAVCASRHVVGSVFVNLGGLSEASMVFQSIGMSSDGACVWET